MPLQCFENEEYRLTACYAACLRCPDVTITLFGTHRLAARVLRPALSSAVASFRPLLCHYSLRAIFGNYLGMRPMIIATNHSDSRDYVGKYDSPVTYPDSRSPSHCCSWVVRLSGETGNGALLQFWRGASFILFSVLLLSCNILPMNPPQTQFFHKKKIKETKAYPPTYNRRRARALRERLREPRLRGRYKRPSRR